MVKKNRIIMLVLAATVLAMFTSGSAFAATSWSGTDHSWIDSTGAWMYSIATDTAYIPHDTNPSWNNYFENYQSDSYWWPQVKWNAVGYLDTEVAPNSIAYLCYVTDFVTEADSGTTHNIGGPRYMYIQHKYGWTNSKDCYGVYTTIESQNYVVT